MSPPISPETNTAHTAKALTFRDQLRGVDGSLEIGASHDGENRTYLAHKNLKLRQSENAQWDNSRDVTSRIFEECYIYINGETDPPSEELKRLFRIHGGNCESFRGMPTITHFVCNNFNNQQLKREDERKVVEKRKRHEYVTQEWIIKSIEAKERLPESDFSPFRRKNGSDVRKMFKEHHRIKIIDKSDSSNASLSVEKEPYKFLEQYLAKSRLHFIGSWRDRAFCVYGEMVKRRKQENISSGDEEEHIPRWLLSNKDVKGDGERVVLHADMDCFFVSALIRDKPNKQERLYPLGDNRHNEEIVIPIAVAHSGNADTAASTSEISSCNYSARRKNVENGMWMTSAKELCPELEVLEYDFALYERVSKQVYEILLGFGAETFVGESGENEKMLSTCSLCELVSVDEAYLELPAGSNGVQAAQDLQRLVYEGTGCPISIGIGRSKLLARLATIQAKPPGPGWYKFQESGEPRTEGKKDEVSLSGATPVESTNSSGISKDEAIANEVSRLPLKEIPSVGYKAAKVLSERNFNACADVQRFSLSEFKEQFSGHKSSIISDNFLSRLYELSHGRDERPLVPLRPQKSIGLDVTWGIRFSTASSVKKFLKAVSGELKRRLLSGCFTSVGIVTIKIMQRHPEARLRKGKSMGHGKCYSFSKSHSFRSAPIKNPFEDHILNALSTLYDDLVKKHNIAIDDLRGVGAQCGEIHTDNEAVLLRDHASLLSKSSFFFDENSTFVRDLLESSRRNLKGEAYARGTKQLNQYFSFPVNAAVTLATTDKDKYSIEVRQPDDKLPSVRENLQIQQHSVHMPPSCSPSNFKATTSQEEILGALSQELEKKHLLQIWKKEFSLQENSKHRSRTDKSKAASYDFYRNGVHQGSVELRLGNKRAHQPRIDASLAIQGTDGRMPIDLISEHLYAQRMFLKQRGGERNSDSRQGSSSNSTGGYANLTDIESNNRPTQHVYIIDGNNDDKEEEGLRKCTERRSHTTLLNTALEGSLMSSQDFVAPAQDGNGRHHQEHLCLEGEVSSDFFPLFPMHEELHVDELNQHCLEEDSMEKERGRKKRKVAAKIEEFPKTSHAKFGDDAFPWEGITKLNLTRAVREFVAANDNPSMIQVQYTFDYTHWLVHSQRHDLLSCFVRALQSGTVQRTNNAVAANKNEFWDEVVKKTVNIIQEQALSTNGVQIELDIQPLNKGQ